MKQSWQRQSLTLPLITPPPHRNTSSHFSGGGENPPSSAATSSCWFKENKKTAQNWITLGYLHFGIELLGRKLVSWAAEVFLGRQEKMAKRRDTEDMKWVGMKEGGTSVVVGGDHSYGNGPSHVCFLNKRKMKSGIRGFFSGPTNSVNVYSLRWRLAGFVETDQLLDFWGSLRQYDDRFVCG